MGDWIDFVCGLSFKCLVSLCCLRFSDLGLVVVCMVVLFVSMILCGVVVGLVVSFSVVVMGLLVIISVKLCCIVDLVLKYMLNNKVVWVICGFIVCCSI